MTSTNITPGQQYIGTTGTVLTVTRVDRNADGTVARVIVRNESDGYVGWHGDFVQQAADGDLILIEATDVATSIAHAEIDRYRAADARVRGLADERGSRAYWDAVHHRDIIREIASTAVKATFRRISLARAREIVIFCLDNSAATIADATAQLGYTNR